MLTFSFDLGFADGLVLFDLALGEGIENAGLTGKLFFLSVPSDVRVRKGLLFENCFLDVPQTIFESKLRWSGGQRQRLNEDSHGVVRDLASLPVHFK